MLAPPSVEDVAAEVHDAVTSVGIESFHGRTERQAWRYVEPHEAAWELLGEAVGDVLADMKRRADLGLHEAARAICCGLVLGLHRARGASSDGPLGWAPDFPAEEACRARASSRPPGSPGIASAHAEGKHLAARRDTLLPALLLGGLPVGGAERALEAQA